MPLNFGGNPDHNPDSGFFIAIIRVNISFYCISDSIALALSRSSFVFRVHKHIDVAGSVYI